jgi:hypothetical protein
MAPVQLQQLKIAPVLVDFSPHGSVALFSLSFFEDVRYVDSSQTHRPHLAISWNFQYSPGKSIY